MLKMTEVRPQSILIVDDDHAFSRSVYELLTSFIMDVNWARTGAEALEALDGRPPDLVMVDLLLTDMSGLDLIHKIRAQPGLAAVPIVVTSGFVTEGDRAEAMAAGANAFLAKPFSIVDLDEVIKPLVGAGLPWG